jgi:signal transduction histidine kinase
MTVAPQARRHLLAWSALLSATALLALGIGPVLLLAVALIPLRIGTPLTLWVLGWLRGLADLHRLWAVRVMGTPIPRPYRDADGRTSAARLRQVTDDPATWRDLRWLPANATAGILLAGIPVACLMLGLLGVVAALSRWRSDAANPYNSLGQAHEAYHALVWLGLGMVLLIALWWLTEPAMRGYATLQRWLLAPAQSTRLANRIAELTQSRADTLDTQAAEIRRIERDLHDGAQAKLVALGMSLGLAEKLLVSDPAAALQLLADAKRDTGHALSELRDLVRGIQPPILADRGLDGAARALVLANPLPVELDVDLPGRPPAPVESAVYFALTEVLANVTKHSAATSAWVRIDHRGGQLGVMVADNGLGGASKTPGGGLSGIQQRLAAFDGTVTVASPTGGPTIITMEVPCPLASGSS